MTKKISVTAIGCILVAYPFLVSHDSFFLHTMIFVFFYSIMAIGLNIIMRTGQLSIGQAAFMAFGAYFTVILMVKYEISFWLSWPFALIITGIIAFLFGLITLRITGINFAILTFAFGEVVGMVLSYTDYFGGITGIMNIPVPANINIPGGIIINFANKSVFYYLVLLFGLLCFYIYYRLVNGSIGRVFHSIQESDQLAECCGVDTLKMKIIAFVTGSLMSCGVGALYACYFSYISPASFTYMQSVDLIIINMIGGVSSIFGPIIGSIFIIIVPEALRQIKEYEHLIFALVLILFIYFIPQGISGCIEQRFSTRRV